MENYDLFSPFIPAKVIFGAETASRLSSELPASLSRIMLVSGNHALADGTASTLEEQLKKSGRDVLILSGIPAEPPLESVDELIRKGHDFKADAVVALGGGSVIDCAKTAAALMPFDDSCIDYFSGAKKVPGEAGLFFCAMPTTAGTGSEMTRNALLTDSATSIKQSIRSCHMLPSLAIVDPALTLSCSQSLTASSGLDAFVQAAEAYANPSGNTVTRAIALNALWKIYFSIKKAYSSPDNIIFRSEMAEGSMLAGMSFAQCGLGAIHGLAHPIGSLLHVPHGVACAILMPYIFEFNSETCPARYAEMGSFMGMSDFPKLCRELNNSLDMPLTFAEYGLSEEHFDFIIKNCRSGSMKANPRYMTDARIRELLEQLAK